jgi:hypothetical protein
VIARALRAIGAWFNAAADALLDDDLEQHTGRLLAEQQLRNFNHLNDITGGCQWFYDVQAHAERKMKENGDA